MQYLKIFSIAYSIGLLLLFAAIRRWAGQKKTPRARAAAEIMNTPEEDELDRAIENKVMRFIFNCMIGLLYLTSVIASWVGPYRELTVWSLVLLVVMLYLYLAATWIFCYRYTRGDEEYRGVSLRGLLLRIAGLTLALGAAALLIFRLPSMGGG